MEPMAGGHGAGEHEAGRWDFERLASRRAILFADLVESVRHFKREEARTFDRWHRYKTLVHGRVATVHAGRLVRTTGDGLLLDFAHAADATRAAFDLHRELMAFNAGESPDKVLSLRVGLHLAEVVAEEHELWGHGVNVAQRLATLAHPGQTVASAALRSMLGDGVQADIQDMGERIVKHLDEPMRAFLLSTPGAPRNAHLPSTEDLRPAVAVVPFVALPADPEHDALGHAMADDIIASLSRHPGLRVLSRASTAAVRGQALPLSRLRELLGASFLLTGQFYLRGNRVRLSAELCELRDGQVLWAGGVSGEVDALFDGQDELVPHIVGQVSQQVLAHELARVRALPMDSLASYSLLLGAQGLVDSLVPKDFNIAHGVLEHLSERHPRQAAPHAMLASWHLFKALQGWTHDAPGEAEKAYVQAQRAMEKDATLPASLVADGVSRAYARRDFDGATASYEEAIRLDPHCAPAWARLSECLSQRGLHDDSLQAVGRAISLSPLDPQRFVYESYAARTSFVVKRYDVAADLARASIRRHALHAPSHRLLVASLWMGGQQPQARGAAQNYLRLLPNARAGDGQNTGAGQAAVTPFVQALHDAGLPF